MHHKQNLASLPVIQRTPSVSISLKPQTVEAIDTFIRNVGAGKGVRTRSEAIQFILDEALPRYCQKEAPKPSAVDGPAARQPGGHFEN